MRPLRAKIMPIREQASVGPNSTVELVYVKGLSAGRLNSMIRAVQSTDVPVLAKLYLQSYATRQEEKWDVQTCGELLSFLYQKRPDLCFVVEQDSNVVGAVFGSIKPWWDGNHLILEEIFVDPAIHGKGVGKILLKEVCEKAVSQYQATHIEAMTFRDTELPKNWYFNHGFHEINEWMPIEGSIKEVLQTLSN